MESEHPATTERSTRRDLVRKGTVAAGVALSAPLAMSFSSRASADVDPSHEHTASQIVSGVIAPARLGTGTPTASTVLAGDSTYKQVVQDVAYGSSWSTDAGAAPSRKAVYEKVESLPSIASGNTGITMSTVGGVTSVIDAPDAMAHPWCIDEDNFVSNSATRVPTQQSVKAYVDNGVSGGYQFTLAVVMAYLCGVNTPGQYYSAIQGFVGSVAPTQSRLYLMPVMMALGTIDRLVVDVHTGASGSNVRLGIYSFGASGLPGPIVANSDTGSGIATASAGIKTFDYPAGSRPVIPSSGLYYIGYVAQGGAPSLYGCASASLAALPRIPLGTSTPASGASYGLRYVDGVTGSLPSTPSLVTGNSGRIAQVFWRYSA